MQQDYRSSLNWLAFGHLTRLPVRPLMCHGLGLWRSFLGPVDCHQSCHVCTILPALTVSSSGPQLAYSLDIGIVLWTYLYS